MQHVDRIKLGPDDGRAEDRGAEQSKLRELETAARANDSGKRSTRRHTRIIMIASWLLTTSHSPSVARISKWSSLLSSSSRMSGSATT